MKALLLGAGLGTRLRPITDTIPKCLVPIKGEPLLGIWLERLHQAGIRDFLVNTHYFSDQVDLFVKSNPHADSIQIVYEKELLGTAGTLLANMAFFGKEDALLIHADNYCLADFDAFFEAHQNRPEECLITMMTFRTDSPLSCGILELNDKKVVMAMHEKVADPPGNLANGAVYILSQELLAGMSDRFAAAKDFSTEVLPHLMGKIFTYETLQPFIDIGTPEAYAKANSL